MITPNQNDSTKMSTCIDAEGAVELNLLLAVFDHKRPVFYRDFDCSLYACCDDTMTDVVRINQNLLKFIPDGKFIDVRKISNH